jgi:hypothetical protein
MEGQWQDGRVEVFSIELHEGEESEQQSRDCIWKQEREEEHQEP